MKLNFKSSILAFAIAASTGSAEAKTLTIASDMSGSNPLVSDERFALSAAEYVANRITELDNEDVIRAYSFGARKDPRNLKPIVRTIGRRYRTNTAANDFGGLVARTPLAYANPQETTNLVAFLEFTPLDCSGGGEVIVITDGLETGYVSPTAFKSGKASLPSPDVNLSGCTITFYGLGAGMAAPEVKHLRNQWQAYFDKAGATFNPIIK